MNLEDIRHLRHDIERLANQYGARNLRIFGSVARGEDGPESDIDILVSFEQGRSLLDEAGLQLDLVDLLGCNVDVVSEGGISPYLKDRIFAEAIPL